MRPAARATASVCDVGSRKKKKEKEKQKARTTHTRALSEKSSLDSLWYKSRGREREREGGREREGERGRETAKKKKNAARYFKKAATEQTKEEKI